MAKTIALFNHKGGVSKTTTTFNLGWMLAEKGHRVVMVDADPQCNLTGLVMDYDASEDIEKFYQKHPSQNIKAGLAPAFESQPRVIEAVKCIKVKSRSGLLLVPGHVNLSEYEVTLGIAQELSGSIQALKNLPGAMHYFIQEVATKYKADFVLLDMNPSLGSINQNILLTSDYFIVPTAPDYFSAMAIDSLSKVLPRWIDWARRAHALEALKSSAYPFPEVRLKFLGAVIQKYRPRKGEATVGFQSWIDSINDRITEGLIPTLKKEGVTFKDSTYKKVGMSPTQGYCLAQIPDFNTLIATSQSHKVPVFALQDQMFGHTGTVLAQDRQKRDDFHDIFSDLADSVVTLIDNE